MTQESDYRYLLLGLRCLCPNERWSAQPQRLQCPDKGEVRGHPLFLHERLVLPQLSGMSPNQSPNYLE